MFNRYKIFLLAVITLLLLTGLGSCNQQGYNPPHTQNQKPEVPGDSVRLVVTPYEYKEGKFDITYPQFEGMADRSAQDKMNDLIR